jgi:competence protein CoiA
MLTFAVTVDGKPIFPESFSDSDWQTLKDSYRVGDFLTPCCRTPAIPKTSINFVRFFAHYSDECATSPESLWHLASKDRIVRELASLGISAALERPADGAAGKLKSDVYFEAGQSQIAVEVQHSYQHLSDYLKRQEKYSAHGIDNYWLLYRPRYMTVLKSIARHRLRDEYGGKVPPDGKIPSCLPDLPLALFEPETDGGVVIGAGGLRVSIAVWLRSLIGRTFVCKDGAWRID